MFGKQSNHQLSPLLLTDFSIDCFVFHWDEGRGNREQEAVLQILLFWGQRKRDIPPIMIILLKTSSHIVIVVLFVQSVLLAGFRVFFVHFVYLFALLSREQQVWCSQYSGHSPSGHTFHLTLYAESFKISLQMTCSEIEKENNY